jgi:hypothetical protein
LISQDNIIKWLKEEKQLFEIIPPDEVNVKDEWGLTVTKESISVIKIGMKKPRDRNTLEIFFYLDLNAETIEAMIENSSHNPFVNELQLVILENNLTVRITPNIRTPSRYWIYSNLYSGEFTKQDLFNRIHLIRNAALKTLVVFRKHVKAVKREPSYEFGTFP